MRRQISTTVLVFLLIGGLLAGCGGTNPAGQANPDTQTITDMAGREVVVPPEINKVYATSATGSVLLYTLAPDKLAGWNDKLRAEEIQFVAPEYQQLPILGRWKGTTPTGSIEDLLRVGPDLIISVGDVSPAFAGDADAIEEQTGIPVVMVDGSLAETAKAYRFLGGLIDETERAAVLAAYCDRTLEEINTNLASVRDEEKVRVYYAEGMEGLETEVSGTVNAEAFDLAGAKNVATPPTADVRRMQVSIEQIINWDPELIIISSDGDPQRAVYNNILNDRVWANIEAVKNGEIYEIPCRPYDWINRPPSVVRLIGVKWLSALLYPDTITLDIRDEIHDFYALFFDYDISDGEIGDLLLTSERR